MGAKIRAGRLHGWLGTAWLLAGCAALAGCASDERIADDWVAKASAREASAPLGGEALAQRKLELDRSYRDLGHFLNTLDGLHRRKDRSGLVMFGEFADFYATKHVIPMLEAEWQSRHPEVTPARRECALRRRRALGEDRRQLQREPDDRGDRAPLQRPRRDARGLPDRRREHAARSALAPARAQLTRAPRQREQRDQHRARCEHPVRLG